MPGTTAYASNVVFGEYINTTNITRAMGVMGGGVITNALNVNMRYAVGLKAETSVYQRGDTTGRIRAKKEITMSKFRKRPDVVDAFKWTGDATQTEDPEWIVDAIKTGKVRMDRLEKGHVVMLIDGLNIIKAWPGEWIVRDLRGRIFPMSESAFKAVYEPVVEKADPPARDDYTEEVIDCSVGGDPFTILRELETRYDNHRAEFLRKLEDEFPVGCRVFAYGDDLHREGEFATVIHVNWQSTLVEIENDKGKRERKHFTNLAKAKKMRRCAHNSAGG